MYRATSKLDRLAKESLYFTSQARRDDGRDGKSKQCCDFLYEREVMIPSGSIKLSLPLSFSGAFVPTVARYLEEHLLQNTCESLKNNQRSASKNSQPIDILTARLKIDTK